MDRITWLKSNLIASGLEVGVYRAKVSDARNYTNPLCGGINVTESITIKKKELGLLILELKKQNQIVMTQHKRNTIFCLTSKII